MNWFQLLPLLARYAPMIAEITPHIASIMAKAGPEIEAIIKAAHDHMAAQGAVQVPTYPPSPSSVVSPTRPLSRNPAPHTDFTSSSGG